MGRIIMEFERGGSLTAELLQAEAPHTCKAILGALPYRGTAIHAMWAGEEIFFDGYPLTEFLDFENETNDPQPGSVACIASPAVRRLREQSVTSFCLFYGVSRPRKGVDQTVDVNVFARVTDVNAMAEICRRIRRKGAESISIRSAGGGR